MAKLPEDRSAEIRPRLVITLQRLHPDKTEFTLDEVMEALHVMGELKS